MCGQITLDPVILEAGRKFSFEIKKHENPIIVWNYLSTITCFWRFYIVCMDTCIYRYTQIFVQNTAVDK